MISPQFTDKYRTNKYKQLLPVGTPRGKEYLEKFLNSSRWELLEKESKIKAMNDNRMDIDEGTMYCFENLMTGEIVTISSNKSRSGKTVTWLVEPFDVNYIF